MLFWLIMPGLCTILALGAFGALKAVKDFAAVSESFADSLGSLVAGYLDETLEFLDSQAFRLTSGQDVEVRPHTFASNQPAPFFRLLLVGSQGFVEASWPAGAEGGYLDLTFDSGDSPRLLLSRPMPAHGTDRLVLYMGRRSAEGAFLVGEIDLEAFQHHLSDPLLPEEGQLVITDIHGNLITHPDMRRVTTQDNIGHEELFRKARQSGQVILARDQQSQSLVVATAWFVPLTGWRIFVIKPLAAVALPVLAPLGVFLCAALLFFALLTIFLRYGLRKHLATPLDEFAESMRRLARGERDTHAPYKASSRELLTLFHTFRAMALRVRKRERELTASRERFRQLVENMEEVFWVQDMLTGDLTYVSPSAVQVLGWKGVPGRLDENWLFDMVHGEDARRVRHALERTGQPGLPTEEEFRIVRPPHGEIRWLRMRAYAVRLPSGQVQSLVGFLQDISDKRRMDESLGHMVRATASVVGEGFFTAMVQHLAEALEVGHALIVTYDDSPPTRACSLAFWSRGQPMDPVEYDLADTPCGLVAEHDLAVIHQGLAEQFPEYCLGQGKKLESFLGVVLHDSHGKPVGHMAIMDEKPLLDEARSWSVLVIFSARAASEIERRADQSRMAASLAEKEILLKEIHHRVKNNLQVVSSLMSLQATISDDPKLATLLSVSRNRVQTMALVHEEIYRSADLSRVDQARYLRTLLDNLLAGMSGKRAIQLRLDIQDISLPVNLATPCGLIVNELFTNALKHAFNGRTDGHVQVAMTRSDDGWITLTMRDNGVGFPTGLDYRATETLGMQLVVNLVRQLDGSIEPLSGPGTAFVIRFRDQSDQSTRESPARTSSGS